MFTRSFLFLVILFFVNFPVQAKDASVEGLQVASNSIAKQLNHSISEHDKRVSIALTTMVDASTLRAFDQKDPIRSVADALTEGLFTELRRTGLNVIEVRGRSYIELNNEGAFNLSSDVDRLPKKHRLDWILVGTLIPREHGVMANVRVLDRRSQTVIAAAEEYIPDRLYWPQRQVRWTGGVIERNSAKGAQ